VKLLVGKRQQRGVQLVKQREVFLGKQHHGPSFLSQGVEVT
jgi:hypothetical protein